MKQSQTEYIFIFLYLYFIRKDIFKYNVIVICKYYI